MTDKELREAAERIVMSKESGFSLWPGTGHEAELAYDAEAEAVASRLLELLPPADDGDGMPFDAWSFVRDVLRRGPQIERDCDPNQGYERYSVKLDVVARELADKLKPHLRAHQ